MNLSSCGNFIAFVLKRKPHDLPVDIGLRVGMKRLWIVFLLGTLTVGCQSVQTPTSASVKIHRHQGLVESSRWNLSTKPQNPPNYRGNLAGLSSEASLDKALRQNLIQHYDPKTEPWVVRKVPQDKKSSRVFSLGPEDEDGDTGIYLSPVSK